MSLKHSSSLLVIWEETSSRAPSASLICGFCAYSLNMESQSSFAVVIAIVVLNSGCERESVGNGILRGFGDFLKGDIFRIRHGHAFGFQQQVSGRNSFTTVKPMLQPMLMPKLTAPSPAVLLLGGCQVRERKAPLA